MVDEKLISKVGLFEILEDLYESCPERILEFVFKLLEVWVLNKKILGE
jgi:hypothetical protein